MNHSIFYEAASRHTVSCGKVKYCIWLISASQDCWQTFRMASQTVQLLLRCVAPDALMYAYGWLISNRSQYAGWDLHKKDVFRRIFWTCHILERYMTSASKLRDTNKIQAGIAWIWTFPNRVLVDMSTKLLFHCSLHQKLYHSQVLPHISTISTTS
jgi:hypothetical protein